MGEMEEDEDMDEEVGRSSAAAVVISEHASCGIVKCGRRREKVKPHHVWLCNAMRCTRRFGAAAHALAIPQQTWATCAS